MADESDLWKWLAKARPILREALHITRVENAATAGMPDVEGHIGVAECNGQFWFELKCGPRPARGGIVHFKAAIRDKQIEWNDKRWTLGANNFWLVQVGDGADRSLYLAPGNFGPRLRAGIMEAALAVECVPFGIFRGKSLNQVDLIKRAILCRKSPSNFRR